MKNQLISWLAAIVLLSGCSGNISLIKRKYSGGFYLSVAGKNHALPKVNAPADKKAAQPVQTPQPGAQTAAIRNIETDKISGAPIAERQRHKSTPSRQLVASADNAPVVQHKSTVGEIKSLANMPSPKKSSEMNFILMVILCFFPFINLIPVYLHDGRSITMNFWLTLILDCLVFIPGIVFALLVILDIVDLR
jgi:uncharacterized membrane protein YqaE (UPF0057 family)